MLSGQTIRSWMTLAAAFSFGLACMSPLLVIQPELGMVQPIVELFDADAVKDRQILLLESIWSLWSTGERILALVIGVCALLLPILKFQLLYFEHAKSSIRVPVKLRDMISKLAMAEVFLIALILVVIKEMPGGTEVQLAAGFYWFLTSVLIAIFI